MKKIIGLSLFAVLAMVSCKKNESAEQLKVDSTQVAAQQAQAFAKAQQQVQSQQQAKTQQQAPQQSAVPASVKK